MFVKAPETKALFGYSDVEGVATLRMRAQGSRIWNGLKHLVGILDMEGVLQECLKHWRDPGAFVFIAFDSRNSLLYGDTPRSIFLTPHAVYFASILKFLLKQCILSLVQFAVHACSES